MEGYQEFIALYLNSPSGIKEMQRLAVTTSGLYNLSVGKIRGIKIPLPPLNQQNLILSKIREYIFICDNLKISIQSAQQTQLHRPTPSPTPPSINLPPETNKAAK